MLAGRCTKFKSTIAQPASNASNFDLLKLVHHTLVTNAAIRPLRSREGAPTRHQCELALGLSTLQETEATATVRCRLNGSGGFVIALAPGPVAAGDAGGGGLRGGDE